MPSVPNLGCGGFPGCGRPIYNKSLGLCVNHNRQRLRGRQLTPLRAKRKSIIDEAGNYVCIECDDIIGHKSEFPQTRTICSSCSNLKTRFNITIKDYRKLLELQGGSCFGCGRTKSNDGKSLAVDHDRRCCSGEKSCGNCVRGILCSFCNRLIGLAHDDTSVLLNLVKYLQDWNLDVSS